MIGTSGVRARVPGGAAVLVVLALSALAGGCARASPVAAAASSCGAAWVTAWNASGQSVPGDQLAGRTLRMQARPQTDGTQVRLRLSNRYGDGPLVIGATTAARGGSGPAATDVVPVLVAGRPGVTIPAGQDVLTDPVPIAVTAGVPLAVSMFLAEVPSRISSHPVALQTAYLSGPGDGTSDLDGAGFDTTLQSWPVLAGVDVLAPRPAASIVLIGDSLVDGVGSTPDGQDRLTDALAARLRGAGGDRTMTVLNAGLSRNQLLDDDPSDGGDSPLTRFEADVAGGPATRDVLLQAGTNDIEAGASAAEIVDGLTRFAEVVRDSGRRVILVTIPPSTQSARGTPRGIAVRDEVNDWVRARGAEQADVVVDFAAALADPSDPRRLRPAFDSGDGLHPSPAGYRAMADAIPARALSGSPCLVGTAATPAVAEGR
ncbi:GDSL-type esterase/lipase family protein [Pseudonocardia sp. KRD291]|uniref:GDSL-type esterase/lipase family protein n=1 Tax=Pseudonocardia sp. KRD291 TaxID=2792007 RepID=UPI001C4A2106|nr:GDSL-type esterase/lipase family protein [Pseudonocardia sp. KRD291]MBW0104164.1 SGNH/GDSL hydrolase family protein [Pseudonocardia sp. KRD291]